MVTRQQTKNIASRIDALAAAVDPQAGRVKVVVFDGETPEFAMRRHVELRPEHARRRVIIERRRQERTEARELAAVFAGATEADFRAFKDGFDRMLTRAGGISFLDFYDDDSIESSC